MAMCTLMSNDYEKRSNTDLIMPLKNVFRRELFFSKYLSFAINILTCFPITKNQYVMVDFASYLVLLFFTCHSWRRKVIFFIKGSIFKKPFLFMKDV